jgi:hypothetical protein
MLIVIRLYLLSDIRKNYRRTLDPIILFYIHSLRQETIRKAELKAIGPSGFPFHDLTSKSFDKIGLSIFPISLQEEDEAVERPLQRNVERSSE